jgi:hypothetical protein
MIVPVAQAAATVAQEIANYPTSRDYRQLWTLAQTAAIVCIVDFQPGKPRTCRNIASTIHSPEYSPELVQVSSRGIGHIWAESVESFIAQCEHCNLEWLVPPGAPEVAIPGEQWHEDDGPKLWWRFPVEEPPYAGTPNDSDWLGLHTHFTRLPPAPVRGS